MDLQNKIVVLTGATGGIGRLLAEKLVSFGTNLIVIGRDAASLATIPARCRCTSDLSDRQDRHKLINKILSSHPQIDILINCAGVGIYKPSAYLTSSDWYSSYELNVHTPFFLSQSLEPTLTVNIGSCSALQHHPTRTLYNSTKAALRLATLCLADERPGKYIHITLDSTLTNFGSLNIAQKQTKQAAGKFYLNPDWVSGEICRILELDNYDSEYTLSPDCYEHCGVWRKP